MNRKRMFLILVIFVFAMYTGSPKACDWMEKPKKASPPEAKVPLSYELNWWPSISNSIWDFPISVEGVSGYNPDCRPSLTADGRLLYFHSQPLNGPAYGGEHYGSGWNIYVARWNGTTWDSVTNLGPNVNPGAYPFISPDGNIIYFDRGGDIWMSTLGPFGWTEAAPLPPPVNTPDNHEGTPAISFDGRRLYFGSNRPGGFGGEDIWVARWNGSFWDSVTNLGPGINTAGSETRPFETADGLKLYFSDFGGAGRLNYGGADLWVSTWQDTGWSPAVNLGPPVNTDLTTCSVYLTPDQSRLYTASESYEGAYGDEDVWQTDYLPVSCRQTADSRQNLMDSKLKSSNLGSWVKTGELAGAMYVHALIQASDGAIYAATYPYGDVFKTADEGLTWTNTGELLDEMHVYSLLEANDGTIYAGTYPHGDVFKTTNGGDTWANTADLLGATSVRALYQASDGRILAGVYAGTGKIFYSTNGGATWDSLASLPWLANGIFCLYEAQDGSFYAGGWGYPAKSTDGGTTWLPLTNLPFPGEHRSINSITQTSDGTIWCAGWVHGHGAYIFKTTDGGASWDTTGRIMIGEVHAVRIYDLLEANDGSLFIGFQPAKDSVCFRSTDNGATWVNTGVLSDAYNVLCLLQADDGAIYAGTTPNGDVFKYSTDSYVSGDANGDGVVNVADVIYLINY
ncbi:MAG: hypothetical protein ACE5KJ_02470, partial [Candidatus Zixiibacteriota bacterium]